MARRAREIFRAESGQALVEAALLIPVLVILLAGVFDLGRYYTLYSDTQAACDVVCRQIENDKNVDTTKLNNILKAQYPGLYDNMILSIGEKETETSNLTEPYHYYRADGTWGERAQRVSQDKHKVTLTLKQSWVTPGLIALTKAFSGDKDVTITATNTAVIDRTVEVWKDAA